MNMDSRRHRFMDLLADRALTGLSAEEDQELKALTSDFPDVEIDCLDRVAAELQVGLGVFGKEPMPARLFEKLKARGTDFVVGDTPWIPENEPIGESELPSIPEGSFSTPLKVRRGSRVTFLALSGWIVAAAAVILVALSWFPGERASVPDLQDLVVQAPDLRRGNWRAVMDYVPAIFSGDTVWSNEQQAGFMSFRGLPVNRSLEEQYQLWIFDDDQMHPIDGGVFDIPTTGEVVIPVDAKIRVSKPTKFAITIEKPGGVVVSDRSRLILLADLG